ncbi:hypothetical protein THTE_0919 [Thermogutta terrifontis]|uniref:Uncharacterized protein n=1 Tax=Thermogutta terrifontis TaxID=1331910 RepID=A0A286RC38_9BACT|nr:hypothetical protein THTE_0919 [Thermogutta terrifontis]
MISQACPEFSVTSGMRFYWDLNLSGGYYTGPAMKAPLR